MKKVIFWKDLGLGSRQSLSSSSATFYFSTFGSDVDFEPRLFFYFFLDTKAGLKHEKDFLGL